MSNKTQNETQRAFFRFPRLSEYAEAFSLVIRELKNTGASSGQIIAFLKGKPSPPDIPESLTSTNIRKEAGTAGPELDPSVTGQRDIPVEKLDGYKYTATYIVRELGIYSENGNPHAHAVSEIINKLFLDDIHSYYCMLFETKNVMAFYTLYDAYTIQRVREWLEDNCYPFEIDGLFCTYSVRYRDFM